MINNGPNCKQSETVSCKSPKMLNHCFPSTWHGKLWRHVSVCSCSSSSSMPKPTTLEVFVPLACSALARWFFLTQDPLPWNHVLKRGNPSSLSSMVHLLIHVAPPGKKNTFAWISWQDYSKLIFIFLIGPDFAALCALGAMLQTTLKMDWRRHWNVFCLREAPQCT